LCRSILGLDKGWHRDDRANHSPRTAQGCRSVGFYSFTGILPYYRRVALLTETMDTNKKPPICLHCKGREMGSGTKFDRDECAFMHYWFMNASVVNRHGCRDFEDEKGVSE